MHLSGQIRTTCPPDLLVKVMRDPAALAQLLPPGSKMALASDGTYAFSVTKSVGPIRLTLPGTMQLAATGQDHNQTLTAHAAHLIGGKVDLTLALTLTTEGRVTHLAYAGDLTATGLAGRVLAEHKARANNSLKAALLRLKIHAEAHMDRPPTRTARA